MVLCPVTKIVVKKIAVKKIAVKKIAVKNCEKDSFTDHGARMLNAHALPTSNHVAG